MALNVKTDRLTTLAIRMKRGNRKAAAELYDELLPKLYGYLYTRTGKREIAEDLSQDVFVKLVEKMDHYDETKGRFVVWFWQIVRNMLVDYYREKKEVPFSAYEPETVETFAVTDGPNVEGRIQYGKLQTFLQTLADDERELFELRYVVEMPYKEIADLLKRSEGSLRVAALRIKEKIKDGLEGKL